MYDHEQKINFCYIRKDDHEQKSNLGYKRKDDHEQKSIFCHKRQDDHEQKSNLHYKKKDDHEWKRNLRYKRKDDHEQKSGCQNNLSPFISSLPQQRFLHHQSVLFFIERVFVLPSLTSLQSIHHRNTAQDSLPGVTCA